jgi:hypothetical protein
MHHWIKRLAALAGPLLLTGCLWGPGKFNSDLTLRKDGSFVLDYRGEIVLQIPEDEKSKPWAPSMATCYEGMENDHAGEPILEPDAKPLKKRPCTAAEIAGQKADYEKSAAADLEKSKQAAKMFGLPGLDDESNRAFAAKLSKYAGWRSVTYRGKGVFDVDYHFEGRSTQDFLFPALPDNNLIIPFVAMRRRADGSVLVTAPALTGGAGAMNGAASSLGDMGKGGPVSRAQGRFTIITDGEILTNNSEDGPAPHPIGRQVRWDVSSSVTKIPEALIRL